MLALAAGLVLLPGLGATDLWAPDEPRYAQVAEEVRAGADGIASLVLLRLNGEVYTQKPPLYFWLSALAGTPGGRVSEVAARLPSALAGIACVWLIARFGAHWVGRRGALLAAALLLTCFEFAYLARRAQLDVLLTLFEMIALGVFWQISSTLATGATPKRFAIAGLHGALGLAVLTKGPVGFIVPALIIIATLAWESRLHALRHLAPPWAFVLSLAPALAWIGAASHLAPEGFLDAAVTTNLFERFFSGSSHERPFYYFFYQLPLDFLPWTLLWPAVAWVAWQERPASAIGAEQRRAWRFLVCWVGVSLLFFSLSAGKRGLYLLPAFPALALLCGDAVERGLGARVRWPVWGVAAAAFAAVALILAGASLPWVGSRYGVDIPMRLASIPLLLAAIASGAWRLATRAPWVQLGVVVAAVLLLEIWVFQGLFPRIDREKSPRPVAISAAKFAGNGAAVGLLAKPSLLGGLLYYGGRPVSLLEDADAVERFRAAGGTSLVAPINRLDRLPEGAPFRVVERFRQGPREIQLLALER
jgi:4-amino-4-deoxy-L-arabinose transferase-like glycosyltransferase